MRFEQRYFDEIYDKDSLIDGDYNARQHAAFLKSKFSLLEYDVKSIADFGFGKASLLYQVAKHLKAKKVFATDISKYSVNLLRGKDWANGWSIQNKAIHLCNPGKEIYDLGICNSVLQYVPDAHLESSVEKMARAVKFLYLHIPTAGDYQKLKTLIDFTDPYAFSRSKKTYLKLLKPHFNFVSWGLVESKYNMTNHHQVFFDTLYRF